MDPELVRTATDVATYVGAVSAGVSANALTESARSIVQKVRSRISWRPEGRTIVIPDELISEIAELLARDEALRAEAEAVVAPVSVDRSIIVNASTVSDIKQVNQ